VLTVVPAVAVLMFVNGVLDAIRNTLGVAPLDFSQFEFLRGNFAGLVMMLAVAWAVGAFGEELLRGVLLNALADLLRPHAGSRLAWAVAILVTSIAFGAGHAYYGVAGAVIAGFLAAGFGLVYLIARRNLWAPILTHGLFDTVGFIALYLMLNQDSMTAMIFGSLGGAPCLLLGPGTPMIA
jgi:membrane protease YdiL (CAAX protease family)